MICLGSLAVDPRDRGLCWLCSLYPAQENQGDLLITSTSTLRLGPRPGFWRTCHPINLPQRLIKVQAGFEDRGSLLDPDPIRIHCLTLSFDCRLRFIAGE